MEIFTPMRQFLNNLKGKNYQNRKVGIIENGTWAPNAGKCMKDILTEMKNIEIVEPNITIRSTLKNENIEQLEMLADNILK
jgi:flavorubredoxin